MDIVKYECVGHVQKRLGISFKTLCTRTIYEEECTTGSSTRHADRRATRRNDVPAAPQAITVTHQKVLLSGVNGITVKKIFLNCRNTIATP